MKVPPHVAQKILRTQPRPRQPKYRNQKTTVDGQTFDSRKEARRYQELKLLQQAGVISDLVRPKPYQLEINGQLICTYKPDFEYINKNGDKIVEDVKGVKPQVYRIKKKLMKAIHNIEILET